MNSTEKLSNLVLAPYIIKATALIGKQRQVGGNQFRHAMATLAILLDYKLFDDYVVLKAAVIHDLFEDVPETNVWDIRNIKDPDANNVVDLALELTRSKDVDKETYLRNILENGSKNAKLIKVADRIDNITDLHIDTQTDVEKYLQYIDHAEKYILPMAEEVNKDMVKELRDLIVDRRKKLSKWKENE
jgi:(p)ppGpp synthase/HD superfamily hydrolase